MKIHIMLQLPMQMKSCCVTAAQGNLALGLQTFEAPRFKELLNIWETLSLLHPVEMRRKEGHQTCLDILR